MFNVEAVLGLRFSNLSIFKILGCISLFQRKSKEFKDNKPIQLEHSAERYEVYLIIKGIITNEKQVCIKRNDHTTQAILIKRKKAKIENSQSITTKVPSYFPIETRAHPSYQQ